VGHFFRRRAKDSRRDLVLFLLFAERCRRKQVRVHEARTKGSDAKPTAAEHQSTRRPCTAAAEQNRRRSTDTHLERAGAKDVYLINFLIHELGLLFDDRNSNDMHRERFSIGHVSFSAA
jgi:hypothetical protein